MSKINIQDLENITTPSLTGHTIYDDGEKTYKYSVENQISTINQIQYIHNSEPIITKSFNVVDIELLSGSTLEFITYVTRDATAYEVYIPKGNQEYDEILGLISDGDYSDDGLRIIVNGVESTGFITTQTETEWVLIYDNGPVTYVSGQTITITYKLPTDPILWCELDNTEFTMIKGDLLFKTNIGTIYNEFYIYNVENTTLDVDNITEKIKIITTDDEDLDNERYDKLNNLSFFVRLDGSNNLNIRNDIGELTNGQLTYSLTIFK